MLTKLVGGLRRGGRVPKGPMQPASKAGSDKPASSAESNGAAKELKSEGVGKVRLYPHSCVALVWLSVESCLGQSAANAECLHRSSLAWGRGRYLQGPR